MFLLIFACLQLVVNDISWNASLEECWASAAARIANDGDFGYLKAHLQTLPDKGMLLAREVCCKHFASESDACSIEAGSCKPLEDGKMEFCWPKHTTRSASRRAAACCPGIQYPLNSETSRLPSWMQEEIDDDLLHWSGAQIAKQQLDKAEREFSKYLCRIRLVGNRVVVGRTSACKFRRYGPPIVRDVVSVVDSLVGAGILGPPLDFLLVADDYASVVPSNVPVFAHSAPWCQRGVILLPLNDCLGGLVEHYVQHEMHSKRWETEAGIKVTWIGCFVDDNERDLRHGPQNHGFTTSSCANACSDFAYMALQAGGWCACGNSYATASQYVRLPDSDCRKPCYEDSESREKFCGTNYKNAMYKLSREVPRTAFAAEPQLVWRGTVRGSTRCFSDSSGGEMTVHSDQNCNCLVSRATRSDEGKCIAPRCRLVQLAEENPDEIVVGGRLATSKTAYVPDFDWAKYLFHASVDALAYNTLANWRPLLLGRVLFKQTSDLRVAWFRRGLRKFVHYVPMDFDLSNTLARIAWAKAHPNITSRIRERGALFANQFLRKCRLYAELHVGRALADYSRLLHPRDYAT